MGSVWLAVDEQLDRRVAVKLIVDSMADLPEVRTRFLREAQAAGKLRSPYVVQVLDYGVDGSTPFMVLEWLEGEDLNQRLKRCGRLSPVEIAKLLRHLGKGLRRAHDADLVHRDIKPPNLFIARHDDEETLKILDFGIAKGGSVTSSGDNTKTGVVVGSLRYMSPEQARGLRAVDHRADVWSVGVVTFQALTGALPYEGEGDADLLVKLCTERPRRASDVDPGFGGYDAFFERCFDRDIEKRFDRVEDLVVAFHRAAGLEEPAASSISFASQSSQPEGVEALAASDGAGAGSAPGARGDGITADPVHPTLRGSTLSLRPRRPLRTWALIGSGLAATATVVALIAGAREPAPAVVDSVRGAPAAPSPTATHEPSVSAAVAPPATAEPAAVASASASSSPASSASAPATKAAAKPGPAGPRRPAIPENPY